MTLLPDVCRYRVTDLLWQKRKRRSHWRFDLFRGKPRSLRVYRFDSWALARVTKCWWVHLFVKFKIFHHAPKDIRVPLDQLSHYVLRIEKWNRDTARLIIRFDFVYSETWTYSILRYLRRDSGLDAIKIIFMRIWYQSRRREVLICPRIVSYQFSYRISRRRI